MKTTSPNTLPMKKSRFPAASLAALLLLAALPQAAQAAGPYYWDNNSTTAGFGTAGGTWATPTVSQWSTTADGTGTPGASITTTTSDDLNFGYLSTGLAAASVTVSGTQNANSLTFAYGSGAITLSGGTGINLPATSTITVNNAADTISFPITGAGTSLTKNGTGALTLSGINTNSGATTISGGTLQIGSGGGSLNGTTGTDLTFNGSGTFNVQEATASVQGMGALTFSAGEGDVISTAAGASSTATLTFASMAARSAGATANFNMATNTTLGSNKIALTSSANAPVSNSGANDPGIFFNLNDGGSTANYARYDTGTNNGYFRGTIYGTDANTLTSTTGSTSAKDVYLASGGAVGGVTANTIRYTGNNLTQTANSTVYVNGILLVGTTQRDVGASSTTSYLQPAVDGGEVVLACQTTGTGQIRVYTIIQNRNGQATKVTMAGSSIYGIVNLASYNTYTGVTTINAGVLRALKWDIAGNASSLGTGGSLGAAAIVINGGTLNCGNNSIASTTDRLFTIGPAGATLDNSGNSATGNWTIGSGGGNIAFLSSSAPATLTLANNVQGYSYQGIGTLGADLGDPGTGANITSVIKTGSGGTWQLAGANTYHGNTTISAGTLILTAAGSPKLGSLTFYPTANRVCNKITGAGAVTLNGTFNIDTTNAAIADTNQWTLVDVTGTKTYSLTAVNVSGTGLIRDSGSAGNGVWTKAIGNNTWTYTELSGALSLTVSGGGGGTITGAATATAFTTTYGTASTAQTFAISGSGLTVDITATAPTGYQVSSDGSTYGSTATFTQSGGSASGTLSVRLSATAAVSGSYNSKNIVLSSTGATSVNVTTASSGNSVSAKALSITAPTVTKVYNGLTAAGTVTLGSLSGFVGTETVTATGTATAYSSANVGSSYSSTVSYTLANGTNGGLAANYSLANSVIANAAITPATLTITANNQNKPYGTTQTTPVTGSSAFTASGLQNSETVGTVTLTYASGGLLAGDSVGSTSTITPSAAGGGTFTAANYNIGYVAGTLTVTAVPTITLADTLSAVNTTYGTASATPTSFHVSGSGLTGNLTVAPPSGYEVSLSSGSGYTTSLSITASGTLSSTQVYVRLAATAGVAGSPYSGTITVSGGGASSQTIATASSTVSPATLTLTANNQSKLYGATQTTPVTGSSAFTPTGLKNSETVGTVTLTYGTGGLLAMDAVGSTSTITPSAAAGGTFNAGNYTIGYVQGTLTVVAVPPPVVATGGTVTTYTSGGYSYNVHTFTGDGTFTVTSASGGTVNYLVIGGGGGGGGNTGGGGGAGGFLANTATVTGGNTAYAVTVGSGGPGGTGNANPGGFGTNGNPSSFGSFATASGGGGGAPNAASGAANGKAGGSGGGASWSDTNSGGTGGAATGTPSSQGNAGGACLAWGGPYAPGGGGGASAPGVAGNKQNPGANGGAGLTSSITGTPKTYAGGGGGGAFNSTGGTGGTGGGGNGGSGGVGTAGTANTGGGGGGQGGNNGSAAPSGGSGVVIISYVTGISYSPQSTGATLTALEDTSTPLAASNLGYSDPNSVALAAVQITTLPALGTLKLSGTLVTLNQIVAVADINSGNLTYQAALNGNGTPYTTIGIKVQNANNYWSDAATLTVNVTAVNDAPTSTGGAVSVYKLNVKTFASTDFQFSDVDTGDTLHAIKITSLPAHGALKYGLATVLNGDLPLAIPLASIPTLTYTPTTGYTGSDAFNFQVSDGALYSADTTMAITVTPDILVQNGSFETPGTALGGAWFMVGSPWSITSSPSNYQVIQAVAGGYFTSTDTGGGTNIMLISVDDCPLAHPLVQNLSTSVTAGDTLSVTFSIGKSIGAPGGTGVVYFDVAGTKYPMVIDTTGMTANSWQTQTFTQTITNSGNLTLGFYSTSAVGHNSFVDNVSNVWVGSVIIPSGIPAALTTTYGTASSPTTVTVTGAALTADITATAPTGYEVSSTGSSYGNTATFTQTSGSASGTLYVRLAATATVAGTYNSQNIVLSSSGARSVNVTTAASGNTVGKATPTATLAVTNTPVAYDSSAHAATVGITSSSPAGGSVTNILTGGAATQTAPGTYAVTATYVPADTANYNTLTAQSAGDFVITATPYSNWAYGTFANALTDKTPGGDPDSDSYTNLQEFAFGTDPTTSSNGTITYTAEKLLTSCGPPVVKDLSPGTGGVDYRAVFCRRKNWQAEGLTYTVQFVVDLDFTPGNTQTVTMDAGNATVLATDAANVMEAVSVPYPWLIPYTRNGIPGHEKPTYFRVGVSSSN